MSKTLWILVSLLSTPLFAGEEAVLAPESSKREVQFYNTEISGVLLDMAPDLEVQKKHERGQRIAKAEFIGGLGSSLAGFYFFDRRFGKPMVVGGSLLAVKGLFDQKFSSSSKVKGKLEKCKSFETLIEKFGEKSIFFGVHSLEGDLIDDIINGIDLGVSAKRRCEKFVVVGRNGIAVLTAAECEKIVLSSLAAPEEIGRRHAPPPADKKEHEELPPAP